MSCTPKLFFLTLIKPPLFLRFYFPDCRKEKDVIRINHSFPYLNPQVSCSPPRVVGVQRSVPPTDPSCGFRTATVWWRGRATISTHHATAAWGVAEPPPLYSAGGVTPTAYVPPNCCLLVGRLLTGAPVPCMNDLRTPSPPAPTY